MCGRYNFSKESSSELVQAVLENLQSRQIEVKTGEVFPGDVAAVIASNRKLEPQAFGMKWGYQLPDGKLIFNARSETAVQKAMFADGMRQRRCLVPADSYYEWQKTGQGKQKYEIAPAVRQIILCKRISTNSRISRLQCAGLGLIPLVYSFPGGWDGMRALRGVNTVPVSREP